ncbi:UNVERIFIED_CONTAM: hypothetical protein PYX00_007080 [Menopon gallinae]|uniref:Asparaginase n=1 Tax=Menopon gallinae TaxID=328185 RepID=A0AAW2HI89_9NEOP
MAQPVILVHGGAGNISDGAVPAKLEGMKKAVQSGYEALSKGLSSLDAVQAAVKVMEDDPAFNAGKGSVLNLDGEIEMDAIIMEGSTLKVGAVGAVKRVPNPISLARIVLEKSPHVLLVGEGANRFAAEHNVATVPAYRLVTQKAIDALEAFLRNEGDSTTELGDNKGTVGAVAIDSKGRVAVATSTGGVTGKAPGRVGDTPIPGSGGYADDKIGAVSTTGQGESIMRACVAHRILMSMKGGKPTQQSTEEALKYMTSTVGNTAGAITLSNKGEIGIYFTSKRMGWAYKIGNNPIKAGVDMPQL